MKCPQCQSENRDGVKFCEECGAAIELTCPACKSVTSPSKRFCGECGHPLDEQPDSIEVLPASFADGRYSVKKFLADGSGKRVYSVHDTVLDRDVVFTLIKSDHQDNTSRTRILREVRSVNRLGDHPNIANIFDFGEYEGQPYLVLETLPGGDVGQLIGKAPDRRLSIEQATEIAKSVCQGLEYAHAKGIIHRGIRPGNIWIGADGIAKVADFGLAAATDMSRLAEGGVAVGTVSYIPPEQAMGGEVTNKSDLYSLGATLYEMVTGRPPFVGDDSVAIVGQLVTTPPVSPTWHRPDLPPALETLILRLLEKSPEKRPDSATAVLQALEAIQAGKPNIDISQKAPAVTTSPLYRRVFVGREAELKQLQSAFDAAASGQGALMMVVGEPGIGKTAVCEQLATYVTLKGGKAVAGHCYEKGSPSLPYLAFVEAIRSYVLSADVDKLRKELGTSASDVARIVSEISEKLHIQARKADNSEEDRYRLLQGVASFLTHAAAAKPMLVILEDLHDADNGTLEMLSYISRNLAESRLLVVGTYRDVEVDRNNPLSAALAKLRRASTFGRVQLRGLNADEVKRMLDGITGDRLPLQIAQALHNQTEGNPLFVQEVIRYLTEEKILVRANGNMIAAGQTSIEDIIPEGLRDVIGRRLSSLSENCNRLLSIAAVIGREFRLDVLQKVAGSNEEDLAASIEEAKQVAILRERRAVGGSAAYRFAHAFFRNTLYEENIAPRRIRLHQQVARVLEEFYSRRLQDHAAELAEHFSHSAEPADLTKAVSYGEMAARRAMDVHDYGEAIRLLRSALKVQEVLDAGDKGRRCDLLIQLGFGLSLTQEYRHAVETEFAEAFALAEEIGDNRRASIVCTRACMAVQRGGSATYGSREALEWAERADRYAEPDTIERAWADAIMGATLCFRGNQPEGIPRLQRSLEPALAHSDRNLLVQVGMMLVIFGTMPWSAEETLRAANILAKTRIVEGMYYAFVGFIQCGRRELAEEVGRAIREAAAISGEPFTVMPSMLVDVNLAFLDGRLEEALKILDAYLAYGQENGHTGTAKHGVLVNGMRTTLYLGSAEDYPESKLWSVMPEEMNQPLHRRIPLLYAHLGQVDEVNQRLERMLNARPDITSTADLAQQHWLDIAYLESAVLVKHHRAAELLLGRFKNNTMSTTGNSWLICVARQLGAAAVLLERYDEAREHYRESLRVAAEMRFRPDIALTRFQLAELLLEHYPEEKKEAIEHLQFAIEEFREMKMKPYLEKALRLQETQQDRPRPSASNADDLTDREIEVVRLLAAGKTNREIAAALFISEHTAASHIRNILSKANLPNRSAAAAYAVQHHLMPE